MKKTLLKIRILIIKKLIDLNEKFFFENKILKFYKKNSSCNLIIDVGANKGQSIDLFLKINPNAIIHAFEPNNDLFELLTKKYKNNKNVFLYAFGISKTNGNKIFHQNIFDYTSSFESVNKNSKEVIKKARILGVKPTDLISKSYQVTTIRLIDFINEKKLVNIDVLKIDTEGHEYECLEGLFYDNEFNKHFIKYIQIEKLNNDMYDSSKDSCRLLEENNFIKFKSFHHGFGNFDDIVFVNKNTKC